MKKKLQIHLEGLDDKVSRFGTSLKHLQLMEVIFYLEKNPNYKRVRLKVHDCQIEYKLMSIH